ncbi:SWPV1-150 [Shearwaterpox virus]|uniref:SWPV1-150 n=1 Tax=Shearwaterpox virus TaxID=1974596 RepID=A0A1V0S7Y3_CNPV|nr:SWPV1-150 [Shearwaterpox virus]
MENFIIPQLSKMEEAASINIQMLDIIITRCITTKWILLNILLRFMLDSILIFSVICMSITYYINRNKMIILLITIINLSYELFIRFLIYIIYESID